MKREIKFRVWCNRTKEWLKYDEYGILANGKLIARSEYNEVGSQKAYTENSRVDATVSFWTGLKDKNGKEIYEGDILSMHNGQYNSQVVWDTDRYIADHIGNGGSESITTFIEDLEIIGNIYENPELLKKYDK